MGKIVWELKPLESVKVLGFFDESVHHITPEANSQILPGARILSFPSRAIAHYPDRKVLKSIIRFILTYRSILSITKFIVVSGDKSFEKSAEYRKLLERYGIPFNFLFFKASERERLSESSMRFVPFFNGFIEKNHLL